MSDSIIQKIAPIIRAYYDARGRGLYKTCEDVVDVVESLSASANVFQCANVFRLGNIGLDALRYHKNDRLMVSQTNRLNLYEIQSHYAYNTPTIKECKWKLIDDGFAANAVSVEDLLAGGAVVFLVRAT